jgi:hypothetical protein
MTLVDVGDRFRIRREAIQVLEFEPDDCAVYVWLSPTVRLLVGLYESEAEAWSVLGRIHNAMFQVTFPSNMAGVRKMTDISWGEES